MKRTGKWWVVLGVAALSACTLTACGGLNLGMDESQRMEAYVKGYLDLTYLGQYNEDFLEETDMTEAEGEEQYLDGLLVEAEFFEQMIGVIDYPTEESTQRLVDLYQQIYSHSDYTVGEAQKMGSGNYGIEVTVRPIDIMTKFTPDDFQLVFEEVLSEAGITTQEQLDAMTEEEYQQLDANYTQRILDMVEAELPNIGNGEEKSYVVQIKDDGSYWTPVQDDFDAIDQIMIDYSNFGY